MKKNILDSSINELRFALLQILHLKSTLQEVEAMTTDPLAKGVIENGLARHEMDKLIHARTLCAEKILGG